MKSVDVNYVAFADVCMAWVFQRRKIIRSVIAIWSILLFLVICHVGYRYYQYSAVTKEYMAYKESKEYISMQEERKSAASLEKQLVKPREKSSILRYILLAKGLPSRVRITHIKMDKHEMVIQGEAEDEAAFRKYMEYVANVEQGMNFHEERDRNTSKGTWHFTIQGIENRHPDRKNLSKDGDTFAE